MLGLPIHAGILDYYQQGLNARKEGHYAEAIMLFERLIDEGDPRAEHQLAMMYLQGEGVGLDPEKVVRLLDKSANKNHAVAQYELGRLYLEGEHVEKNQETAVFLFGLAAENGLVEAQLLLADMFYRGDIVARNYKQAYIYLLIALQSSKESSPEWVDAIESHLSREEINSARTFVQQWLKKQHR
jgi:TPR repeat protein